MAEQRRARRGVTLVFFVYGAVLATWVSRIPLIKQSLGLDTAQLSLALLGSPAGLIVATQLVSALVGRYTSATVTRWGVVAASAAMVLPSLAWNLGSLAAALFLLGMSLGSLDVAMNTQGVAIERGYARPIMSGIHGMYSVGVLAGALVGSLAAQAGVDPRIHFAVAAAVLAALGAAAAGALLGAEADAAADHDEAPAGARVPPRLAHHRALIALGAIAFCCLFAEGAVDDWSGVYLHEGQGASLGLAPLGAAACGIGMAIGRFGGDAIIARYGRPATLWRAALIAGAGMTLAVLAPGPGVAIAGYAVLGLGVATIVPIAFTLGGTAEGVPPAWGISRVTMLGYAGVFSSPPAIGLVAQVTGLAAALAIPAVLLVLVAPLSRLTTRRAGA
jgi:fucose permease